MSLRECRLASRSGNRRPFSRLKPLLQGDMVGLLLQWPTIPTLIMFPILVTMYILLARREEREAIATFGEIYIHYAKKTPAYFPILNLAPTEQDTPNP